MAETIDIVALGGVKEGEKKRPRSKEPRRDIACQTVEARIQNYNEVALGYTPEIAVAEAMRRHLTSAPRRENAGEQVNFMTLLRFGRK